MIERFVDIEEAIGLIPISPTKKAPVIWCFFVLHLRNKGIRGSILLHCLRFQGETPVEPTSKELADACRNVLTEEDCNELASLPMEEALNNAFTMLIENGIDDPEAFLKEKGILE